VHIRHFDGWSISVVLSRANVQWTACFHAARQRVKVVNCCSRAMKCAERHGPRRLYPKKYHGWQLPKLASQRPPASILLEQEGHTIHCMSTHNLRSKVFCGLSSRAQVSVTDLHPSTDHCYAFPEPHFYASMKLIHQLKISPP
jgi:hypothetical protein